MENQYFPNGAIRRCLMLLLLREGGMEDRDGDGEKRGRTARRVRRGESGSGRLAGHQDFAAEMVGRRGQAGRAGCQRIEKIGEGEPAKDWRFCFAHTTQLNSTNPPVSISGSGRRKKPS